MSAHRYRFGRRIAAGATGEVYRGEFLSEGFSRPVAIKLLKVQVEHREEIEARFRDEARMMAMLAHPSIVRVEALCSFEGRLALVMELVDGADLSSIRDRYGPLPPRAVAELLAAVAGALQAAWTAMEIVHRDIKPQNIAINQYGAVKVLDFGAARARFVGREAETTNVVPGTMPYVSPDRLVEEGFRGSPASDLWALGATAVEVLLGQPWPQLRRRLGAGFHLLEDSLRDARVPPALAQLLLELLEEDPQRRPSAEDVVERSEDLVGHMPGASLRSLAPAAIVAARRGVVEEEDQRLGTLFSAAGTTGPAASEPGRESPKKQKQDAAILPVVAVLSGAALLLSLLSLCAGGLLRLGRPEVLQEVPGDLEMSQTPVGMDAPPEIVAPAAPPEPPGTVSTGAPVEEPPAAAPPGPVSRPKPAIPEGKPKPEPTPKPPAESPEPKPPTAKPTPAPVAPMPVLVQVNLVGEQLSRAWLEPGHILLPAKVPPGSYTPWGEFVGDTTANKGATFEVREGQTRTVKCYGGECRGK